MYIQTRLLTCTNIKTNTHRSICSQFVLIYFFSHSNPQQLAWTHLKDLRIIKRCVQYANEKETSHKLQILTTHSPLITNECVEHASQLLSEWRNSQPRGAQIIRCGAQHASPHENAPLPEWHRIHLYMVYLHTSSATEVCGNEARNSCPAVSVHKTGRKYAVRNCYRFKSEDSKYFTDSCDHIFVRDSVAHLHWAYGMEFELCGIPGMTFYISLFISTYFSHGAVIAYFERF